MPKRNSGQIPWLELVFVLVAAIGIPQAEAATYVVAPTGSDTGPGTTLSPWLTLQHAANSTAPGDTVEIQPGTYSGFDMRTSGVFGAPIRFNAQVGVTINQPNFRTPDGINLENASHVIVEGFKVVGMPRAGIRIVGSEAVPSRFVTIRNNTADSNGTWGIFSGYAEDLLVESNVTSRSQREHGIYVSNSADRPIIRHNFSWGNGGGGIQINADGTLPGDGIIRNAFVSHNIAYDNGLLGGAAINLDGVQSSRIENNLLYGNHATGIALFRGDGAQGSSHNFIVNNTVVNAADGRWALSISNGSTNNTVLNNILYSQHSFRGGLDVDTDSLPGLVSNFNAMEDRFSLDGGDQVFSLTQWRSATGLDVQSSASVPSAWFANWLAHDFRLASLSPAINAGTALFAPTQDILGIARPACGGFDVGAYEFPGLPADLNHDCAVDGSDLGQLFVTWGQAGNGDLNADGVVDGADAAIVFSAWTGDTMNVTDSDTATTIPEPRAFQLWISCCGIFILDSETAIAN